MRFHLLFFLIISVYYQAIARFEIAPQNSFLIHSSAELRIRAEISSRESPEDFIVALDAPAAAVSNDPSDISSPSPLTIPPETDLSAAGSTNRIPSTASYNSCSPSSGHKFRKRESCAGKSKHDSADGDDGPDPTNSPKEPERGCSPSGSKLRKREYCSRSSGSDKPLDDSGSDDEKRICPRNRRALCCNGPPSGIYTQGCSDCKYLFLPPSPSSNFFISYSIIQRSNMKFEVVGGAGGV